MKFILRHARVFISCFCSLAMALCICPVKLAVCSDVFTEQCSACSEINKVVYSPDFSVEDICLVDESEIGESYLSDEVLLLFDTDADIEDVYADLALLGVSISAGTAENCLTNGYACSAHISPSSSINDVLAAVQSGTCNSISYAQANYIYATDEFSDANSDGISTATASLDNDWYLDMINAYDAWDLVKTQGQVSVAVIDSGIAKTHADLADRIIAGTNIYDDDLDYDDLNGHGTAVAGLIAATADNDLGIQGVSYNANLIVVDAINPETGLFTTSVLYNAYQWLLSKNQFVKCSNLRVINMSLGNFSDLFGGNDHVLFTAISEAREAGVLTVCAAGNEATDAAYLPADDTNCFSVIALDKEGKRTSYSNYGALKSIAAPGGSSEVENGYIYSSCLGNSYGFWCGTSMASPIVSGVAALLFAADNTLTVDEVEEILVRTSRNVRTDGESVETNEQCVDAYAAVLTALCYHGHSYDTGVVIQNLTCVLPEVTYYTCTKCGIGIESETSQPNGHIWNTYSSITTLYEGSDSGVLEVLYARFTVDTARYIPYDDYILYTSDGVPLLSTFRYSTYYDGMVDYLWLYDQSTLVMTVYVEDETIVYINPSYSPLKVVGCSGKTEASDSSKCMACGIAYSAS